MHVTISGNLCADPDLLHTSDGTEVAELRLAENRSRKDQAGEWQTETSFYSVVCWRSLASRVAASLGRGDRVVVVGRMRQESWTTEAGEKRSRYVVDATDIAASLRFAGVTVERTDRAGEPEPRQYAPDDPERPFEAAS